MSITGKASLSIRKKDLLDQKSIAVGFKSIRFAHKASLGDTGFNLASLTTPTEMTSNGFSNPSPSDLLNCNIRMFRNNLTLTSSLRGKLEDFLAYAIDGNSQINFLGFTAEEGEIFTGVISETPRTGLTIVDARPVNATGPLLAGQTDFNTGMPFKVNENSSSQVGAVKVYRNGLQQFRNSNNSSTVLDGNYYEVDSGDGSGLIIRFNTAAGTEDDAIFVTSDAYVEKPQAGQLAEIENLQGQLDAIIPTVAALAGVPETDYRAAPNNQDLKAFGDIVHKILNVEVPVEQSLDIDLTGNGFTGGTIRICKVGKTVTITAVDSLTHASTTGPATGAGTIPEWARPTNAVDNVYYFDGTVRLKSRVLNTGELQFAYNAARTDAGSPALFSMSYNVESSETKTIREILGL